VRPALLLRQPVRNLDRAVSSRLVASFRLSSVLSPSTTISSSTSVSAINGASPVPSIPSSFRTGKITASVRSRAWTVFVRLFIGADAKVERGIGAGMMGLQNRTDWLVYARG
jgi:hypothetical protein